ncbi:hypothetical protein C8Q73DRAFT_788995 [Cubamyces lactineus]|nr:hypothetical protein C8Q73DRAFT_788995 [Cubamyces lactineus]
MASAHHYPSAPAPATPSVPFGDVCNTASVPRRSPRRAAPSPGSENVPPLRSPGATWNADWEDVKVLDDMGVEDPEEEEQLALFNSIPGFDDDWEEDDSTSRPASVVADSPSRSRDDETSEPESESLAPTQYDVESTGGCSEEEDCQEAERDASSSDNSSAEEDSSSEDSESLASEEESSNEGDDDIQSLSSDADEQSDSFSSSESAFPEHTSTTKSCENAKPPPSRVVRRSARLAVAPKRSLAEDYLTDTDDISPRPTKRARIGALSSESQEVSTRPKTTKRKATQRTTRSPAKPVKTQPASQKKTGGAGSRSGRIPVWFLQKHIANTPAKVSCGAEGCKAMLNLKKLRQTHEHLRGHYTGDELAAAQILCAWEGCGKLVKNGGNNGGLLRHYDQEHLKLRYGCPGKCTDGKGKARTWSRADALTRHERTNPCDYLRSNPIPRTESHAEG